MSLRNGRQVQNSTLSLQLYDVLPAGTLLDFAGASAPAGFFLCDGHAISRTAYVALFNNIGTTYGVGDGSTTFNLPDSRGRVHAGKDNMGGTSASRLVTNVAGATLGASGGAESHTLSATQMPSHTHATPAYGNAPAVNAQMATSAAGFSGLYATTTSAGADAAHNNTQPTLIVNKIIKY